MQVCCSMSGSTCCFLTCIQISQEAGKVVWRRKWQTTPVLLPGKFHGWGSLVGYSPWHCKESDMTEGLHFLSFYSSFWRKRWQPTRVFLPGESHGQRGLMGYSLWGCKESDTTEQLTHTHTHTHRGKVVWNFHLFKNFPQFVVMHTVKGFDIINKAVDISLELSCFFDDPMDVGNLFSGSTAFSKSSLNI